MRMRACSFFPSARRGLNSRHLFWAMFVKPGLQISPFHATDSSTVRGFILTPLGRRRRINMGDPWSASSKAPPASIRVDEG